MVTKKKCSSYIILVQHFDTIRNTPEEASIKSKGVGCNINNEIYDRTSDHEVIIGLHSYVGIIKLHLSGLRNNNHLHLIGVMEKPQAITNLGQ